MEFFEVLKKNQDLAIRLSFIEFKLYYTGVLSRSDLISEFGISGVTASRIISEYKNARENNLKYSESEKRFNLTLGSFLPYVDINAEDALFMLANGFDKNKIIKDKGLIDFEMIGVQTSPLKKEKVSIITRAIFQKQPISCIYNSASGRELSERILIPLVILFDGLNWIFRANDKNSNDDVKYKNFNFSRVISVEGINYSSGKEYRLDYDVLWNRRVPIELEINSGLSNKDKENVRRDYGMSDDVDKILMSERAAFVWIILNQWRIKYSGNCHLLGDNYFLELKNENMLKSYGAIS